MQAARPLYPRGPRSGPGCAVPVHHHLLTPSAPLAGTTRLRRRAVYTHCPRCAPNFRRLGDPRVVPSFRWLFCIDMSSSKTPGVPRLLPPSSFTVDAGLRPGARVSASTNIPHTPIPVRTHDFGAVLPFAFATTCRFACPSVGADQVFTRPTRTFTSGLSTDWSPVPPPDITTGATGQVPLAGLSPARTPTSLAAALRSGL